MINNIFTDELKKLIMMKELVDSYELYNSTFVIIDITDKIYVDIKTTDYFIYLYEEYNLINELFESKSVIDELSKIYVNQLMKEINQINTGNIPTSVIDFELIVLINGQ